MAGIRYYEVTVPPTSDEVGLLALNALRQRVLMTFTGRPEQTDIGPDDEVTVSMRIRSTRHPESGGMRIVGETSEGNTVNMELPADPQAPAEFSMVFDFNAPG